MSEESKTIIGMMEAVTAVMMQVQKYQDDIKDEREEALVQMMIDESLCQFMSCDSMRDDEEQEEKKKPVGKESTVKDVALMELVTELFECINARNKKFE